MSSVLVMGSQLLGRLKQSREDDDWVDRLHYWASPCLLTLLALIIGAKQYVGTPIQCWAPREFQRQWMTYAESYCFVENTYFVSPNEQFPMREAERERRELGYYQWVFFILLGQALLMMAPKFLWNAFNWKSGLNIHTLVERSHTLNKDGAQEGKEAAAQQMGRRMHANLQMNARKATKGLKQYGLEADRLPDYPDYLSDVRPSHCFVSAIYLLFKLLNLASTVTQLWLLNQWMAPEGYTLWGWQVARNLAQGRDWAQSGMFPRVTFCDFKIRQAAQHLPHHRFTLQCVLMINMFNEKVFLFLWFWLLGLCVLTILNLCLWLYRIFYWASAEKFVLDQLRLTTARCIPADLFRKFVHRGLSRDGVTVLRLVASNCGDLLLSSLLVSHLWAQFEKGVKMGKKMCDDERVYTPSTMEAGSRRNSEQH